MRMHFAMTKKRLPSFPSVQERGRRPAGRPLCLPVSSKTWSSVIWSFTWGFPLVHSWCLRDRFRRVVPGKRLIRFLQQGGEPGSLFGEGRRVCGKGKNSRTGAVKCISSGARAKPELIQSPAGGETETQNLSAPPGA